MNPGGGIPRRPHNILRRGVTSPVGSPRHVVDVVEPDEPSRKSPFEDNKSISAHQEHR